MLTKKRLIFPVILLIVGLAAFQYQRPFPPPVYNVDSFTYQDTSTASVAYPDYGQVAVGAVGYGLLSTSGDLTPVPTASTAKMITALAVLTKHPIASGSSGKVLTLDATDVGYFEDHYVKDGSVVRVALGEKISQYDALVAMMLPSGNNMSESLARWAFGSQEAYIKYANEMVKQLGANQTTIADASGFSAETKSTAPDMLKIALAAMKNRVFAEIVAKPTAEVPVAGKVNNVNWLLGEEGVVGIKTGSTDAAGGCFVFAANRQIEGQSIQVIGAILGAPTRNQAINDSKTIIRSVEESFQKVTPLKIGQKVGTYTSKTGEKIDIEVKNEASMITWKGNKSKYRFVENHPVIDPVSVGYFTNDSIYSPLINIKLDHPPRPPSLWQKLLRY